MKLLVMVEVEVSRTLAETIERNGFSIRPDGSGQQMQLSNSPSIPRRKTKVVYIQDPELGLDEILKSGEKDDNPQESETAERGS